VLLPAACVRVLAHQGGDEHHVARVAQCTPAAAAAAAAGWYLPIRAAMNNMLHVLRRVPLQQHRHPDAHACSSYNSVGIQSIANLAMAQPDTQCEACKIRSPNSAVAFHIQLPAHTKPIVGRALQLCQQQKACPNEYGAGPAN
jgi:hypothetical protein